MNDEYTPIKPLLTYIGSKDYQAHALSNRMPSVAFESRFETFAGGLGLERNLPVAKRQAIVNDIDPDVIGAYETAAGDPAGVMAELQTMRSSRATFNRLRHLRDSAAWWDLADIERAAAMIYLSKNSVNANMKAFSVSSKTRSNFNPGMDLRPHGERLRRVTFENLHWRDLFERLIFKPREVNLFAYNDPPYVVADSQKHYRFNFDAAQHIAFARSLARINAENDGERRRVFVMVSYDDDPAGLIRALYRPEFGFVIEKIQTHYASEHHVDRCRDELVITNYDTKAFDLLPLRDGRDAECTASPPRDGGDGECAASPPPPTAEVSSVVAVPSLCDVSQGGVWK